MIMKAYAGIDLGGTNIKYGLADSQGEVIVFRTVPANVADGREALLEQLKLCAEDLLFYTAENDLQVPYVGIGSPGVVDPHNGIVVGHSPNLPEWPGTRVTDYLSNYLNIPVYLANDGNLMALAEVMFGAARGYRNVICTTIGTGIGGAIILEGKLIIGKTFSAGEFGHIPIVMDGKQCNCGLKGCLEAYASASQLIEIACELAQSSESKGRLAEAVREKNSITIKELFSYFRAKDKLARQAIEMQADFMATGLASAVNLLNPDAIVIGGGVADGGGNEYVRIIEDKLRQRIFEDARKSLIVLKAKLGNKAGFIGAAFQKEEIGSFD